jgi:hypothetical protein
MAVYADTHIHLYECYELPQALAGLADRLGRLATAAGGTPETVDRVALLAERKQCAFFRSFHAAGTTRLDGGLELRAGPGPECVTVWRDGQPLLFLIAGRQIVAAEGLEILALTADVRIPDGLPAQAVLAAVRAAGALPVIGWSPGKWFGARGRLVSALVAAAEPGALLLGDTRIRPWAWPEPGSMRAGRARGLRVIAGSDPLPFAGEERMLGTYGVAWPGRLDAADPARSVREALQRPETEVRLVGRRGGLLAMVRRTAGNELNRRRERA